MSFEKFIAARYLQSPRSDKSLSFITGISIFGVALGVMTLIVVLSVMNGFEKDLRHALEGANGHLNLSGFGPLAWSEGAPAFAPLLKNPEVETASPYLTTQALLMGPGRPQGALIKGIDIKTEPLVTELLFFLKDNDLENRQDRRTQDKALPEAEKKKSMDILAQLPPHQETIMEGSQSLSTPVTGMILGSRLARALGVGKGDFVTLVSPNERITPFGPMPKTKRFYVVGFFESGLMGYDEVLALVDLPVAQALESRPGMITGLTIRLKAEVDSEAAKEHLKAVYPFPYHLTSWRDQNKNLFAMFQLEKLGLAVVLSLVILVASFNIISSLVILVKEKQKDIGILKAMGASDGSVQKVFFYQGAVIGLTGTLIGEILGILVCQVIARFEVIEVPAGVYVGNRIPVSLEWGQIGLIAVVSLVICFSVTLWPSKKAARLDPVEALRND